jgi:hypothetical protein
MFKAPLFKEERMPREPKQCPTLPSAYEKHVSTTQPKNIIYYLKTSVLWLIDTWLKGGDKMEIEIAILVAGALAMVGGIVGGGTIYAGLEKLADAMKNKAK